MMDNNNNITKTVKRRPRLTQQTKIEKVLEHDANARNAREIQRIAAKTKAAGMSYGKYVLMMDGE